MCNVSVTCPRTVGAKPERVLSQPALFSFRKRRARGLQGVPSTLAASRRVPRTEVAGASLGGRNIVGGSIAAGAHEPLSNVFASNGVHCSEVRCPEMVAAWLVLRSIHDLTLRMNNGTAQPRRDRQPRPDTDGAPTRLAEATMPNPMPPPNSHACAPPNTRIVVGIGQVAKAAIEVYLLWASDAPTAITSLRGRMHRWT